MRIEEILQQEMAHMHRHGHPVTLLMLQLDISGADKKTIGAAVEGLRADTVEHFQFEEHILN